MMTTLALRLLAVLLLCMALAAPAVHAAEGDIEWRYRMTQAAVTFTANPLSSASRTAFYAARGFSVAEIQPYAQACGFSFGMQNNGAMPLVTRLADWYAVGADGRRIALHLPETWDAAWGRAGVSQAARIAFRWAQFQAENTFEAGDWIMGMATLETPMPGAFRLVAPYHDHQGNHEIVLDNLTCTHDSTGN
jgi:hypothetical protein